MPQLARTIRMIALSIVFVVCAVPAGAQSREPGYGSMQRAPIETLAPAAHQSMANRFWQRLAAWSARQKTAPSWYASYARPVLVGKRAAR